MCYCRCTVIASCVGLAPSFASAWSCWVSEQALHSLGWIRMVSCRLSDVGAFGFYIAICLTSHRILSAMVCSLLAVVLFCLLPSVCGLLFGHRHVCQAGFSSCF